ncbi:BTB/POZ domain-containing protein At2g30600 isoform X1 [Arachis ipaensis]|uniref:BTB/POZ domain-containing protein At2g30600 isoform X1 n=1 Tax=Arachis ipaensis TaxID=130454 RepID=UPI0007AFCA95|nr:BTB/POZ domain-containing protein At2g30600 isoform X1 [Arachis ipaensis]QHN88489.1 BTB/POZ domain-containing protein [Arachis hypogaea]
MVEKKDTFLTVPPFECAWREDLKFREAGRGCVAFEAYACNDVTLVFRQNVGSQGYHYKRDSSPHYTVILGSHRNRRLRIEVNGKNVVDVAGIGLCCSSSFQSYWISIYDGLISVGNGNYPLQGVVFQWRDPNPNCGVQYIGLSSWDKHVKYRNVNVLSLTPHVPQWKHVSFGVSQVEDGEGEEIIMMDYEKWGLKNFLESWELSDMLFIVGSEERPVPAHKAILAASGNFSFCSPSSFVVKLPMVSYGVLHALLQYIYTGWTQIPQHQLGSLRALSLQFEVMSLVKQCEENMERLKQDDKLSDPSKIVELTYPCIQLHSSTLASLPISIERLRQFKLTGQYSDVNIYIESYGLVARAHKVVLSLWSVPFAKMFTNGMSESMTSEITLKDVPAEAFMAMLDFLYDGELNDKIIDSGALLLQLLLLADQFGVTFLHQECCKMLLDCLSEDSVCPLLQVISSIPSCRPIRETLERRISMNFDYYISSSTDFVSLDEATFINIIKHPDLTVTSEEKVLNAILMFGMRTKELLGWEMVDELLVNSEPEILFGERLQSVYDLLPFVRFPLLPYSLLEKLQKSNITSHIPVLQDLVIEAINFIQCGQARLENEEKVRFQHRHSSYRELQYICDGDNHGVLYFAGTSYGEHPWVNPLLAERKTITITASSPRSRYTDPKVLVSRTYQGTCYAGPRLENGHICSWWTVDLGQDHQLMCNYYTLRQDGSKAFPRSWNFQGSLDGKNWTNLKVHENDGTVCKPGQFASWSITGPNALLPFRYFRVVLTRPTVDATNPWNFSICYLELYGYFH